MPDIIFIITKRWKFIFGLTLAATVLALVISLLRPKEYLAAVTALPANSATADKARIFNSNIQSLYPELGSPDELDRIEGTAKLDTIYIAIAESLNLMVHYHIGNSPDAIYKTAARFKNKTDIKRSAYGELKIKVWDKNPLMAAQLANALLNKLNEIHQHIVSANNTLVLERLKQSLAAKQSELDSTEADIVNFQASTNHNFNSAQVTDTIVENNRKPNSKYSHIISRSVALQQQVKEYSNLIAQYELAVTTNPQVLLVVENARPPIEHDKPKVFQTALFAFAASLIFSLLLALFAEIRRVNV